MELEKNIQNKIKIIGFSLLLAFMFFAAESLFSLNWLRNSISYIFEPIGFAGAKTGEGLRSYLSLFTDIGDFREEYNALKIKNSELEVFENYNKILLDQNESLKKQLKLGNKEEEYILSPIVFSSEFPTEISLGYGSNQDISVGDVIVLGNLYIGTVSSVDLKGSTARLPSSRSSSLQVLVVKGKNLENVSLDTIAQKYISEKNIKAVSVGTGTEVRLENIAVDSGVKDGDSVVIADERIGEYLLLGRISSVDRDLAAATVSATVDVLVDYESLTNIFVRLSK